MRLKPLKLIGFPALVAMLVTGSIFNADARDLVQGLLLKAEPVQISQGNAQPLTGYWTLNLEVTRHSDPLINSQRNYRIISYFEQAGAELSGQFMETSGSACRDTSITGSVEGDRVTWTVFYTGSCCGGGRMKFEGVFVSPETIQGTLVPEGNTPPGCTLWWANVVATKGRPLYKK